MFIEPIEAIFQRQGRSVTLRANQVIFRTGDRVRAIHFIVAGAVTLERTLDSGERLVLQRASAGDVLAEASFFARRYHCDACAAAPTTLLRLDVAKIRGRAESEIAFVTALAGHLARSVQEARARVEILALKTVAQRLDAWLAWKGGALPPKGQWREIVADIAVTPEALYREIARRRGQFEPTRQT